MIAALQIWQDVFNVNINGTFLTAQRWLRGIRSALKDPIAAPNLRNVNLIIMGSESGKFGVRTMAAYAAGKAAVQYGLLQSLAQDVSRIYIKGRVNGVAPGAVNTTRFQEECERYGMQWEYEECQATVPMAKPVALEDVARTILFLASERWSGSTHGQLLHVDGGKHALSHDHSYWCCCASLIKTPADLGEFPFVLQGRRVVWYGSLERRR